MRRGDEARLFGDGAKFVLLKPGVGRRIFYRAITGGLGEGAEGFAAARPALLVLGLDDGAAGAGLQKEIRPFCCVSASRPAVGAETLSTLHPLLGVVNRPGLWVTVMAAAAGVGCAFCPCLPLVQQGAD